MAGKFCPSWIFNLCVARTAYDFITSDLPIKAYAKKYASGLSEHYAEVKTEEIEQEAELVLRFLVETNSEESDQLLNNFVFFSLKYILCNLQPFTNRYKFNKRTFDATFKYRRGNKKTMEPYKLYVYS